MTAKPKYTLSELDPVADAALIAEFTTGLSTAAKRQAWQIEAAGKTVGVVWIDLEDTNEVQAPCVHVVTNDTADKFAYSEAVDGAVRYAYRSLPYSVINSCYRVADKEIGGILKKLGFEPDEKPYADDAGVEWQNVTLVL